MLRTRSALAVLALTALGGLAGGAFASAAGKTTTHRKRPVRITVMPASGTPTTRFVVRFKAPQRTGRFGQSGRRYVLSADGPAGNGCITGRTTELAPSRKGARVRATLAPPGIDPPSVWCPGTYHGRIEELQTRRCTTGKVCPAYIVLLGTVGRFSFRVQTPQPPPGGDTTPPSFAGIQTATACTPGPQRPGQTTPVNLSWKAATDNVTPSSGIVYDIFLSATHGGEDFAKPTWTTQPGATTYRTPGLPSHGTFYFVVRARDQAGNEDRNRVERVGADPCL